MAGVRRRAIAEINVVPYIDVMLVLLIVFMVTAPLMTQGLGIKLPEADAESLPQQEEPLVVSLNKNGEYFFNQYDAISFYVPAYNLATFFLTK